MRKWAAGFFILAAAVLFYVACGDSPTSPGGPGATALGSKGAFGPTTGPFGPTTGPFGPTTGPFGPTTGPFGPGPSSPPSGTPTATSTPGGGGTPTATPSGTPGTPTPTPPPPCTATSASFTATDTPLSAPGGGQPLTSVITVIDPNLVNCKVGDVRISYFLTGPLNQPTTFFYNDLQAFPGGTAEIWGFFTPGVLSGTQLGTACNTLFFTSAGVPFPPAAPPYVGAFRPNQTFDIAFGQFPGGQQVNGDWHLNFFYDSGTMTLQCWSIDFTLHP